ncbi:hypothetical protein ACR79T_14140 [Sphingobacterium spiritivorum]|uniref:hypothetical protein n=1 Tax=Sphingobacterium spiritivorum TaxID=258 RepID=UPI003DA4812A
MLKSTCWKIVWKSIVIGISFLSVGCGQESFRRVEATDLDRYETTRNIEWSNGDSSLVMYTLIDNGIFLQEYNILLVLKYYNGKDSTYYLLRDTQIGNYIVIDDKLYIYDRNVASPGTLVGWYETSYGNQRMVDSIFFTGDSLLQSCPDLKSFDRVVREKKHGIYKIDHDTLKVIARNNKEERKYLENIYVPGFYYFSSPGLGLQRTYDLNSIYNDLKLNKDYVIKPVYY